jgi:hypothetical protein
MQELCFHSNMDSSEKIFFVFRGLIQEVYNAFSHEYDLTRLLLNIFNEEFLIWKGGAVKHSTLQCLLWNITTFQGSKWNISFHVEIPH